MICPHFDPPTWLIFSTDVPELLYYSNITSAAIALLVGLFVITNRPHERTNQLLFIINFCFAAWVFINLIAWTNTDVGTLLFSWSLFGILQALISALCILFMYAFAYKRAAPLWLHGVLATLILPVIVLAHTNAHLTGYDLDYCDAFGFENIVYMTYYSFLGVVAMVGIAAISIHRFRTATDRAVKQQVLLMSVGLQVFLGLFFAVTFIASYLANLGITDNSAAEFYGLFGMVIFMVFVAILITQYRAFNIGIATAHALVATLFLLVAAQFTYASTPTTFVLKLFTLIATTTAGILLIRSVKKEIQQRLELQQVTRQLANANVHLKDLDRLKSEFVSIASHQLRSPLTSIRGYASMLQEGSYGTLPEKAREAIDRIAESSRLMAISVEDYLNVSRIQAGNMKYELTDFNLRDLTSRVVDDKRRECVRRGLLLTFKDNLDEVRGIIHADLGKTSQILHNLIDNAMKYTPRGAVEVRVYARKRPKHICIDISDTGIGMNPDKINDLFEKFKRADNANSVNVTGTGLGLYIARKMAEDMGGNITATSPGEGMGSTFTLCLPLQL
jgi:signal transduction histidine kinase